MNSNGDHNPGGLLPPGFVGGSGDMLADRRFDMALQLHERGDNEAAADLMAQAREIVPSWPPAAFRHGEILAAVGDITAATAAFETYLRLDPADRMGAAVKLALLGAHPVPDTLPEAYITSLFDEYAPRFEKHLTETLGYDVPQTLATVIDRIRPDGLLRILDIGCGTGLAGVALSHRKKFMSGVDLSPAMIAQAADKGLYDELHTSDMLDFMRNIADGGAEPYDLIVAADVLIYTGALHPAFTAARALLPADGLFLFSLQDGTAQNGDDAQGFTLGADHRYAYSPCYVRECAAATGFDVMEIQSTCLRQDAGQDVMGLICLLKPASS